jgi:hypothetical protein
VLSGEAAEYFRYFHSAAVLKQKQDSTGKEFNVFSSHGMFLLRDGEAVGYFPTKTKLAALVAKLLNEYEKQNPLELPKDIGDCFAAEH